MNCPKCNNSNAEFYKSGGACKKCKRLMASRWYAANRDHRLQQQKIYRSVNKEKIALYQKQWANSHPRIKHNSIKYLMKYIICSGCGCACGIVYDLDISDCCLMPLVKTIRRPGMEDV